MSVNDPIADMLTRVRNTVMTGQNLVSMPSSKIKAEIARILKKKGILMALKLWTVKCRHKKFSGCA